MTNGATDWNGSKVFSVKAETDGKKEENNNKENEFLSPQDVAKLLGVTPRTVYEWLKLKKIPALKIGLKWHIPRNYFNRTTS